MITQQRNSTKNKIENKILRFNHCARN